MAYGIDANAYLLKEGRLRIGTWSPGSITPATDPVTAAFTGNEDMGDFSQGTLAPELTREYASALVGTPAIQRRKDLTRKQFTWTANFYQFNTDLMTLVQGAEVETGVYDVCWVGTDEVTQDFNGYLIDTELVQGRSFRMALFYGKVTAEAVGPTLPGTAHATYTFKTEGFPHPYFVTTSPNDVRNLGAFIIGPVPS